MKKDMLTIIRKEFARFFKDKRMVFTTVLMPGLLIYLIYTFMGKGMAQEFMTDDAYVAKAYVQNLPEEFSPMLESLSAEWTEIEAGETEEIKMLLQEKKADVMVVFPKDFVAKVEAYDVAQGSAAPNVEIYYNSTESESVKISNLVMDILDSYEASMANKFDINAGEASYDMASEKDVTGQLYAMLLPMLLMTFMYSGCIAVAPESIAGEKERGTIATLLVTPMKRSSLAMGKIVSLSCIALLSGISSFAGTMLSLPTLMGGEESGVNAGVYVLSDYLLLLGIILSTVLVMVSAISVVSAFAKSIKEAGTAVSPLMIIVMLVSLTPMFGGNEAKSLSMFFIPIYNSVQCMHGIFAFTYEPMQVLITIPVNLICAGLLAWGLTRLFGSEKVMFSR
ncbi:MAG: ABC transporter permease [Lachnospiraceae bacterium]|nr:ABC transporter permease [Lachnospiraceae bacterium]